MPAFNLPDGLRACLRALTLQSLSPDRFEVIVVDDGSEPPLAEVVEGFRDRLCVTYLRIPNGGPARARNRGARAAIGQYLAFTDHDCLPDPQWLAALLDGFRSHPACLLGGPKRNGLPGNLYSTAHQLACNYAEQWFREGGNTSYSTTNNVAVPREAFLQVGGFNAALPFAHEDREFGAAWADRGLPTCWLTSAVVVHNHKFTLRTFLRHHFRYGTGAIEYRVARRQEGPVQTKVRFAGLRFHLGYVLAPFTNGEGSRSLSLAALLVCAQVAYLAGAMFRSITIERDSKRTVSNHG